MSQLVPHLSSKHAPGLVVVYTIQEEYVGNMLAEEHEAALSMLGASEGWFLIARNFQ